MRRERDIGEMMEGRVERLERHEKGKGIGELGGGGARKRETDRCESWLKGRRERNFTAL